ncbi:P-type conjugative transfer protein VirB9 [Novosphingobium sediminis]|uniref:P-type conjugative transfer protein VirB9 n=1 Tax=Novosphingobium sediminis TaxID=707214 RepID=A0A512ANB4_9SPHN|nr:TrbG/VirB9 family P-type conjugative transfer protein [Novosphingobium sediminis]GEO01171.1 P-type conjugative transfer protein VirB9 [Novosphingobium sediminis]
MRRSAFIQPRVAVLALALAAFAASAAKAEVVPSPTTGDAHIQTAPYDPQEVVVLHVAPGFATTVIFSADERIETVTVGESSGWQVQVNKRADQLVVKPLGSQPSTNLTVISDQRTYNFLLTTVPPDFGVAPYLVRMTYPGPVQTAGQDAKPPVPPSVYRLSGARDLRPTAMSDDGQFTSIIWPATAPMPAVYAEDEPGKLALVNGVVREGVFVIEGIHTRLVFVRGALRSVAQRIEQAEASR